MKQSLAMTAFFESLAIVMTNLSLMESAIFGHETIATIRTPTACTETFDALIEEA